MTIRRLWAFSPLPINALATLQRLALLASVLAAATIAPAVYAQSSGTQATEEDLAEVTVTAKRQAVDFAGVTEQTAPKSRIAITAEYLDTQTAGQTVFQSINMVPGVNFTNNDPYGSSGGNLRIRSFDGSRVSVTFDGLPLNDSGNYALFTNQMLDPELVEKVEVNLGTTDVDSPTASATGGTVSYRSLKPTKESEARFIIGGGTDSYKRGFGQYNFGEFGPWDTSAWVSASYTKYDKFKGPGEIYKRQFNAMLRQEFDNGNFFFLAFHLNKNRNNFYRNTTDANFLAFGRGYDNTASCVVDAPTAGVRDDDGAAPAGSLVIVGGPTLPATDNPLNPSACTNYYNLRVNPSDTANIRAQSLWHLSDRVILTVDPSIQYTLANGGGTATITENDRRLIGATTVAGVDVNGDGDGTVAGGIFDVVRLYTPNTTNTYRLGVTSSLIWNVSDNHRVRVAYTLDRARHRQTAQNGPVLANGDPENVFAGWSGRGIATADGNQIRGRDRYSIAELNQIAAEYRGQFMDGKFTATVGVRAPDFKRELNQYCYTQQPANAAANVGTILCTTQVIASTLPAGSAAPGNVTFAGNTNNYIPPYSTTFKFDDVLPNLGLTYRLWDNHMFYVSYAEALSAPRTDNLYNVIKRADGTIGRLLPETETTKAFDFGWRYTSDRAIASVALWKTDYKNRIVSAFDQDLGFNVDRNVGDVKLWGVDAQIGFRPMDRMTVSFSASYNNSELQNNIPTGATTFLATAGNALVETPELTFASRADFKATENLRVGIQGKFVGSRFATDLNNQSTPGYTVVDLDASYKFELPGWDRLRLKLNINNLLDEEYYGNISSGTGLTGGLGSFSIGAPRTVTLSAEVKF